MRIAFTGKGGSGKTTIGSLFALRATRDGFRTLALDADINQHFQAALDPSDTRQLRSMGDGLVDIKQHLAGANERFSSATMHKTTPPGEGSHLVSLDEDDWFIRKYTLDMGGVRVGGAGEIPKGNVGVKCYHGLNGAVELVLGHMLDRQDDVVVVDMTAGADAFSSSLFTKVDALVLVVEPTLKSLSVYGQFLPHAREYGIPLLVVANKVEDESDIAFIKEHVGDIVAQFPLSRPIKRRERGEADALQQLEPEFEAQLRRIREQVQAQGRDWDKLQERSWLMHTRAAKSWAGTDALSHIDPTFSLREAAEI